MHLDSLRMCEDYTRNVEIQGYIFMDYNFFKSKYFSFPNYFS